eukprot:9070814-Karenia_brevis.AAC.1
MKILTYAGAASHWFQISAPLWTQQQDKHYKAAFAIWGMSSTTHHNLQQCVATLRCPESRQQMMC